jgi:UPF0176 protein
VTADRRHGWRWGAVAAVFVVGLSACTTGTLPPTTGGDAASSVITAADTATTAAAATGPTVLTEPTVFTEPTGTESTATDTEPTVSAVSTQPSEPAATVEPTTNSAVTSGSAPAPTAATYTPTADADAVRGACPYLNEDEVQADTGQRVGGIRIRPAEPQPVCEFLRNDGESLATVRVLQLDSEATAVMAVDHYVPRGASNPESRPAGWSGGSLATDGGSVYGVSKGSTAVIAETNQKQSVYARLLVAHAIGNLGL